MRTLRSSVRMTVFSFKRLEVGLDMDSHKDGNAGYKQFRASEGWTNEMGMLEGISGIGLVLLSKLADFDTQWETGLLIK